MRDTMEKFINGIIVAFGTFAMLFIIRLIGPVLGAISGLIVGLVFGSSIFAVLEAFGVDTSGIAMWQLGATLSFIGSFFVITVARPE